MSGKRMARRVRDYIGSDFGSTGCKELTITPHNFFENGYFSCRMWWETYWHLRSESSHDLRNLSLIDLVGCIVLCSFRQGKDITTRKGYCRESCGWWFSGLECGGDQHGWIGHEFVRVNGIGFGWPIMQQQGLSGYIGR